MGAFLSREINYISCIDLQSKINDLNYLIINTLPDNEQDVLIKNSIFAYDEVQIIESHIKQHKPITIIIYGKNSYDQTIIKKYKQLKNLGFTNIYIYTGGLFEWVLLQEIYGTDEFETTNIVEDVLKFK
jgi:hypothetical protein